MDGRNKSGHDGVGRHQWPPVLERTAAAYSGSSCPRLSRASTSFMGRQKKDVDGRNKSGHDAERMTIGLLLTTSTLSAVPLRT